MSDGNMRFESLVEIYVRRTYHILQIFHLPNLLERKHLVFLGAIDAEAGGIIPAILESGQSCFQVVSTKCVASGKSPATTTKYTYL